MALVIKIGGHLFSKESGFDVDEAKSLAEAILECYDGKDKWVVVVGGGWEARKYVEVARALGSDEATCDYIAINLTKMHALMFLQLLRPYAYPTVPDDLEELKVAMMTSNLAVVGGLWPGQSTFAVAALCAQAIRAEKMVIATDVDGIYDSDPKLNPSAKIIPVMTYDDLKSMLLITPHAAGTYKLIDSVGLSMAERSKLRLLFVNGCNRSALKAAILRDEAGTIVVPSFQRLQR